MIAAKSENYEGRKDALLDMIEGMDYTIYEKAAPIKATTKITTEKTTAGTVTFTITADDGSDDIKISAVTKIYGSLYINDKPIGEVTEGSIIPVEKPKVGAHTVKIIGGDGEFAQDNPAVVGIRKYEGYDF